MKGQKSKTLALRLIDDLFGEETEQQQKKSDQEKKIPSPNAGAQSKKGVQEDSLVLDPGTEFVITPPTLSGSQRKLEDSQRSENRDSVKNQPLAPEDQTYKLSESHVSSRSLDGVPQSLTEKTEPVSTHLGPSRFLDVEDRTKHSSARGMPYRVSSGVGSTEAVVLQSENLRVAQSRILDLEQEIERLRLDNEKLAAAGETLRRRSQDYLSKIEEADRKQKDLSESLEHERSLLSASLAAKDQEVDLLKNKVEELETRLSSNIHKIRIRERELENRLELVRMEAQALIRAKDEMILELKRQVDQINQELENYRSKGQETHRQLTERQELLRKTVRALRIALAMLEGDEPSGGSKNEAS